VSFWGLVQIFIDLILVASAGFMWVKLHRPAKDDPRMSRGLQLLQSKISVLEDLSDRTETQVTQLTTLMEQKCRDIQGAIFQAEKEIQKIQAATEKSLEVAKIFQDKIPHQEIIERQNTIKYVKAARMAHQGTPIDEIAAQVDLSRGEIEFIAKVNRDQLQFSEEDLPEWAKQESIGSPTPGSAEEFLAPLVQKPIQHKQKEVQQSLSNLGQQFRQALNQPQVPQTFAPPVIPTPAAPATTTVQRGNANSTKASGEEGVTVAAVRKVIFPKIEVNNNLG
jgi:hypothetical protein